LPQDVADAGFIFSRRSVEFTGTIGGLGRRVGTELPIGPKM
jgi:hypothetical protein